MPIGRDGLQASAYLPDAVAPGDEPPTTEERRRMRKDAVARLIRP